MNLLETENREMTERNPVAFTLIMTLLCHLLPQPSRAASPVASGRRGMVATVHPLATEAGLQVLQQGGNAVDAAVAAALTLGVVDGYNSGLGGGCLILVRLPDGSQLAIDGRETAPAAATAEMYLRDGQVVPELSQTGALASGVPGALAAYDKLLRQAGRRTLAQLIAPAADLAEQGFFIDRSLARNLRESTELLRRFAGSREVFLKDDGQPYEEGERLVQRDLARTYRAIAENGIRWFYEGPFARQTEEWMAKNGGIMTANDFQRYEVATRSPILTTYRGRTIVGFPPPSSGGIHVAQILNILECFDVAALDRENEATLIHVTSEAMKLAMADRAHWLGDADFVSVPRGLVDKTYAKQLASRIDLHRSTDVAGYSMPPDWQSNRFGGHTTHIAAADEQGFWVAITATLNTAFGSKVVIPGTGLTLNNQMDDFSTQPGVPNVFGLLGAENNAIAPGKRPLSSMSPTIVLQNGQPVLTLGGAGGPKIITEVVLTILRRIDLGWSLEKCVAEPRWHHQWRPDRLFVEESISNLLRIQLQQRGHVVEELESGILQAIARTPDGQFQGIYDPRVPGRAAGW